MLQVDVSHTLVERLFVQLAGDVQGVLRRGQFVQVRPWQAFAAVRRSKLQPKHTAGACSRDCSFTPTRTH